ncbi:MAG: DUF6531 domain-containing protein [Pseudomonadota bacterium]
MPAWCVPNPPPPITVDKGQTCQAGAQFGNPIVPATGEKIQNEQDYQGAGPQALSFIRTFKNAWGGGAARGLVVDPRVGQAWAHNHAVSISLQGTPTTSSASAKVVFGDGSEAPFSWNVSTSSWQAYNSPDTLTAGTPGLLYQRSEDNSAWQFDAAGRLLTMTQRNGWVNSYSYSTTSTTSSIAPVAGLLTSVSNQFTQTISFTYNAAAQLASISTPDSQTISFSYDGYTSTTSLGRLATVTYPGSSAGTVTKAYLYENGSYPQLLTGIIDESGNRLATYAYDVQGRAVSTQYAGGANLYSASYWAGTVTMTDPLGTSRAYGYSTTVGKLAVTSASLPVGGSGANDAASRAQDANGFITQATDFLGVNTMYTWDINRRLPLATTRASGLPEAQSTSTQWHNTLTLPLLTTQTGRTTAYTYDSLGNKLTESVIDTATGVTRTWAWSYNAQGLAATETAPNGATTQFVYDSLGNLGTSTNALGHTTTMAYDSGGRITQMTAPTGLTTTYAYDLRGRLLTQSVGGMTSTFAYKPTGLVGTATLPSGYQVAYSYDNAQRLTGWQDNRSAQGSYTLDAMGNRTTEQIKDGAGNTVWQLARSINSVNQVVTQTLGTTTAATLEAYGYNANADRTSQANGLSQSTRYGLDGLRRTIAITDPANATATLAYNALDAVTSASDFKGVTTTYARDALGNPLQESTPDAGTSSTSYNSLGLPQTVIDSLGQASTLTYDLLGRPTQIRFADGKTTTLAYDLTGSTYNAPGAPNASLGYLSKIEDRSGSTSYQRDIFGRVVQKTQTLPNSSTQQVTYSFTTTGPARHNNLPQRQPAHTCVQQRRPTDHLDLERHPAHHQPAMDASGPAGHLDLGVQQQRRYGYSRQAQL